MRLTKTLVEQIKAPPLKGGKPTQRFIRDSALPGFGLRVTSAGSKAFIVEKRINNKVKRVTLGKFGPLTVEQARREAQKFLGNVASGQDPVADKREKHLTDHTLADVFDDYLATRKDLKPTTIHDYRRHLDGSFADWRNRRLTDITKDMVELRHRELGQRSQARANGAMRVLRALFNHAMHKYEDRKGERLIRINPVDRLSQNRAWYADKRRQTIIKPHQLAAWYQGVSQLNQGVSRDYLLLLLFTGLRRSEAAALRWQDIDFKDRTLICPDTKNGQPHTLPLSVFLEQLLERRRADTKGTWVFPSPVKHGKHLTEPREAITRVCELSGVTFTLHDLRRTFITIAESLDIPAYALKQLMNHKNSNDVTAGYIIADINRLRAPMQRISDYLSEQMTKDAESNG